jgi:hypothetical protein
MSHSAKPLLFRGADPRLFALTVEVHGVNVDGPARVPSGDSLRSWLDQVLMDAGIFDERIANVDRPED